MVGDRSGVARNWRPSADAAELFETADNPAWTSDRDRLNHEIRDPWESKPEGSQCFHQRDLDAAR
jgi:hypothetical protein